MSGVVIAERVDGRDHDAFERVREELGDTTFVSTKPASTRTYVVAMLPRTGSTAFCSLLARTGELGYPDEYLNPRGPLQYWARQFAAREIHAYIDLVRRERSSANGVFGLKTTFNDFMPLLDARAVRALLGEIQFLYLTRRDLVAQAISEYLAEESGVWHRDAAGKVYRSRVVRDSAEVPYDEERIVGIIERFLRMQLEWERFFSLYSVEPLRLTYEELCADTAGVVERAIRYLGVVPATDLSLFDAATSKIGDERNAEWAARLRSRFTL